MISAVPGGLGPSYSSTLASQPGSPAQYGSPGVSQASGAAGGTQTSALRAAYGVGASGSVPTVQVFNGELEVGSLGALDLDPIRDLLPLVVLAGRSQPVCAIPSGYTLYIEGYAEFSLRASGAVRCDVNFLSATAPYPNYGPGITSYFYFNYNSLLDSVFFNTTVSGTTAHAPVLPADTNSNTYVTVQPQSDTVGFLPIFGVQLTLVANRSDSQSVTQVQVVTDTGASDNLGSVTPPFSSDGDVVSGEALPRGAFEVVVRGRSIGGELIQAYARFRLGTTGAGSTTSVLLLPYGVRYGKSYFSPWMLIWGSELAGVDPSTIEVFVSYLDGTEGTPPVRCDVRLLTSYDLAEVLTAQSVTDTLRVLFSTAAEVSSNGFVVRN